MVLLDGRSASASEVFASALQDLGRGMVVGSRSGGALLLSNLRQLSTGGSQLYAFADFRRAGAALLEGVGVAPDVQVVPSVADLRHGRDAALHEARQVIANTSRPLVGKDRP